MASWYGPPPKIDLRAQPTDRTPGMNTSRRPTSLLFRLVMALALCAFAGCTTLPSLAGRSPSQAFTDTAATQIGLAVAPKVAAHPGLSGIFALRNADNAFSARMLLARRAERSLDVQYYIWHKDLTGTMLFNAMLEAADRGVRVRMLLDDNNTVGLDPTLAALGAHPNIEIRLFNPFAIRSARWLDFLLDFSRLNRRMHNKSFTVDNQVTIVGGRNIGDEYFGATDGTLFADLDVIAIGPVVETVSSQFDRYWASASAYPVRLLVPEVDPTTLDSLARSAARMEGTPAAKKYIDALRASPFVDRLMRGQLELDWALAEILSDPPEKVLSLAHSDDLVYARIRQVIEAARHEVAIVSPYFVLSEQNIAAMVKLSRDGVKLDVLTNSLRATDVPAVYAGYAGSRKPLLRGGIALFEERGTSDAPKHKKTKAEGQAPFGLGSSASTSLHAKTFSVDRETLFVGSFNFDPRSARLNTELGFLITSPPLATHLFDAFTNQIPERAYRLELNDRGDIEWIFGTGADQVRFDTDPGTGVWERAWIRVLSLLPIRWLL